MTSVLSYNSSILDDIRRFLQVQMKAGDAAEMKLRYGVEPAQYTEAHGNGAGQSLQP